MTVSIDSISDRASALALDRELHARLAASFVADIGAAAEYPAWQYLPGQARTGDELTSAQRAAVVDYFHRHRIISASAPYLDAPERWRLHDKLCGQLGSALSHAAGCVSSPDVLGVFCREHARMLSHVDPDDHFTLITPESDEYKLLATVQQPASGLVVGRGPCCLAFTLVPTFDVAVSHEWGWPDDGLGSRVEYYDAATREYVRYSQTGRTAYVVEIPDLRDYPPRVDCVGERVGDYAQEHIVAMQRAARFAEEQREIERYAREHYSSATAP